MSKKDRVVKALRILQIDAPEFFDAIINGDCPHNAGLESAKEEDCGFNDTEHAFVMGYCEECWRLAMGGKS